MPTFAAVVIPSNRRRDGSYPLVIRVTFKGVSRRLRTNISCSASDLTTKTKRIKNPDIIRAGQVLIEKMKEPLRHLTIFELEDKDVDWVVARIRGALQGECFALDFFSWGESVAEGKRARRTKIGYLSALNALERFLGARELDINSITKTMLIEFVEFLQSSDGKKRKNNSYICIHLSKLSHIFNAAKYKYNDEDSGVIVIPRSPFSSIRLKAEASQGQKNLGQELMQRILQAETDHRQTRLALDIFIVSFLTMGANLADLYDAEKFNGLEWVYNRKKTMNNRPDKAEMRITLQPEIMPYIARLSGKGRMWLNELRVFASNSERCTAKVNYYLARWAEREGVERFTFYAARKTFASLAQNKAGVDKATIDECLVHIGEFKVADIYIERDWSRLNAANRKVIDLFEWELPK